MDGFFAFDADGSGLCTAGFAHMLGLGIVYGSGSGVASLGVPRCDGGGHLEGGFIWFAAVGMAQDSMATGEPAYMEPKVVGLGNSEAEQVVVGIGFASEYFPAVGELVVPAVGLDVLSSHWNFIWQFRIRV